MLIVSNLVVVVDDQVKIGDRCIIGEEHVVDVGVVVLLVSLLPVPMLSWAESSPRTRCANNSVSVMRQL